MMRQVKEHPLNISFDVDGTLWKVRLDHGDQVPDYDLIQVLRWFWMNGDNIFIWSAGGMDYAQKIAKKLGLDDMVKIIPKKNECLNNKESAIFIPKIDIAFEDMDTSLAKLDVLVNRSGKYQEKDQN